VILVTVQQAVDPALLDLLVPFVMEESMVLVDAHGLECAGAFGERSRGRILLLRYAP
jgi:hypothetical protein